MQKEKMKKFLKKRYIIGFILGLLSPWVSLLLISVPIIRWVAIIYLIPYIAISGTVGHWITSTSPLSEKIISWLFFLLPMNIFYGLFGVLIGNIISKIKSKRKNARN